MGRDITIIGNCRSSSVKIRDFDHSSEIYVGYGDPDRKIEDDFYLEGERSGSLSLYEANDHLDKITLSNYEVDFLAREMFWSGYGEL